MEPTVTTRYGRVRGRWRDGVASFLGVPYAASPTGPLRFRPPAPPPAWDGIREADRFGATPPKPRYAPPFDVLLPEPDIPGDDWLTVNVWTPDPGRAGLPVMVWIHGGAYSNGNSAIPMYDGHAFARDGAVLVSLNYRLGVDGFALLPDAPANRGLLDQIAALEWVRDNIAAFGGDPGNVTVFGESAGAMSVTTLLSLPRAQGLFARAIMQSGAAQAAADPADAALVAKELGLAVGREATAASLAEVSLPDLIHAHVVVRDALFSQPDPVRFGASVVASTMAFIPVIDGDLIPVHPLTAITAGAGSSVPVLTGTTTDEYRLFLMPTGLAGYVTDEGLAGVLALLGIEPAVGDLYRANRPQAAPGDLLAAVLTDRYFRLPALAVAEARAAGPAATYVYEFAWPSPIHGLGACHSLDIPFVFDNLFAEGAGQALGPHPPAGLASQMHGAWLDFARSGDPGWPTYGPSCPVMVFDAHGGGVQSDPRGDERRIWAPA
ncbi:MAG TPA: carboxylesterase family protein [Streptosporangiaceae bacterium]|jgi:para-nitrobenzyl esterase